MDGYSGCTPAYLRSTDQYFTSDRSFASRAAGGARSCGTGSMLSWAKRVTTLLSLRVACSGRELVDGGGRRAPGWVEAIPGGDADLGKAGLGGGGDVR